MAGVLGNCLKNLIRLAQELKQSIDKIPQNRRNAHKLSENLITDLIDIETFYRARSHVIEATPELEEALTGLLKQTQAVQTRCEQFLITTEQRGWRKMGAAMKAWRECDQVERELGELKDSVHQCYRKFTMIAISRLEQPINQISLTTTTPDGTALQLNESQNVMLGHMESFLTTLQTPGSTAGTPIFIQPPKEVVDALYLHQQVEAISNSLAELSATQTFAREEPNEQYLQPFKTVISNGRLKSSEDVHRDVVAKTLEIIKLLKGDSADLSIQDGAWEMVNLAIRLYDLEMYSDAEAMGRWTVTMFRALVATNQDIYEPYLALALRNLSRYKGQINDDEGSTAAVAESLEIQRCLVQKNPTLEVRSQLSNTLNEYWSIITQKGDNEKGLEIAQESVAITDSIRAEIAVWNEWLETPPSGPPPPYIEPAYVQVDDVKHSDDPAQPHPASLDENETIWLDYNTARALCCLAYSYQDNGRINEAYETQLKSLALYQNLHRIHGGNFEENVASSCAHLCSQGLREGRDNAKSIDYAERALEIYRRQVDYHPVKVSPWLTESLWDYADLLHNEGRKDDVIRVTQEALEIVRKSNQNRKLLADALHTSSGKLRRLEQKETAVVLRMEAVDIYRTLAIRDPPSSESALPPADVVPRHTVPDSLMDLANDFLLIDKEADAVVHCQEAVDIFRTNLRKAPDDSSAHLDLARGLSYLCYCMFRIKEYDVAVKLGNESITIYRQQFRALGKEFKAIESYVSALRRATLSSFYAISLHAISVNAAVIEDLQMLIVDHKDKVGKTLFHAFYDRDFLLGKHGRVRESLRVHEQVIGLFTSFPITDPGIAADYISAHDSYAGNLQDLGRPVDAVRACEKAIDLGNRFEDDEVTKELACALAGARATYSGLLYNLGRYIEAEEVMKCSVKASRENMTPAEDTLLACRLRTYANVRRRLDCIDEALKLNEEAVMICRNSTSKGVFVEARLPYNLDSHAASMLELEDHQKALTTIQEAMELYRKLRDGDYNPMVPWHYCEPIYAEALNIFANCLMATGDLNGAYRALTEAETLYRDIVADRPGLFADQVVCLDLLVINTRALGFHAEAKRISDDLAERLRAMEMFNSEVALLAYTALDELRSRPSQVRLRASFGNQ
ncbi:hypothetical protein E4T56_gene7260 [Termitomyces sp. T112]|nr:hypothetical protein C0989_004645 [Termitomyces sp. Mn162]KAG5734316.1 hypothetical protein E4T56_gene7260 [Termitomyces sp. T112]